MPGWSKLVPGLIRSGSRSDTTEYAYIYCENHWFWAKGGQQVLFTLHTSTPALVAQRIEHLTTDQKVRGSNPFKRTTQVSIEKLSVRFQFGRTK